MSPRWSHGPADTDEQDLYPADVEHVTPELRTQRNRAIFGAGLITVGCGLLVERAFHTHLDYFGLAVGLGLLAGWAQVRRYPMFVIGALFTGSGLGSLITSAIHVPFESTINCGLIAAAFFAVWVRYPFRSRWALVPAAFFVFLAVASFGVNLIGLIPGSVLGLLLPVLLVVGGGVLLMRHTLPRPFVRGALIAIAITFVASAASGVGKWHGPDFQQPGPPFAIMASKDPFTINTTSGDVHFRIGDKPTVQGRRGFGGYGSHDVEVTLPADWTGRVNVHTISGDVDGTASANAIEVRTVNGDVDVDAPTAQTVDVTTISGRVDVARNNAEFVDLNLKSLSGTVDVNGTNHGNRWQHDSADSSVSIDVSTTSGDIDING